jgi:hypothetical protein
LNQKHAENGEVSGTAKKLQYCCHHLEHKKLQHLYHEGFMWMKFFSQSSGSVTSPSNASYTNQSKANTLKTPVAASKTNVKSKRRKKTTLQKWRGNVSSSTSKNRGNCE